jgi:hypothetical protein
MFFLVFFPNTNIDRGILHSNYHCETYRYTLENNFNFEVEVDTKVSQGMTSPKNFSIFFILQRKLRCPVFTIFYRKQRFTIEVSKDFYRYTHVFLKLFILVGGCGGYTAS